ncbi:MAG: DUF4372 domain-containing protein [Prevotellaceae bacterium]|jgi:hypothetical protein|nr:DUF4372 domain-containing protein [Prevotellaceae bacterium]
MYSGKFVFAQLLPFVDRYEFNKCVKRYLEWFYKKSCIGYLNLRFAILPFLSISENCTIKGKICPKTVKNRLFCLPLGVGLPASG